MPVGPSRTAEAVCFARAAERLRPPDRRVLDDPYARLFLPASWQAALARRRRPLPIAGIAAEVSDFTVARHRYIDDRLLAGLESGAEEVVILGAGYDTRAWRFADALAERPLFELDFPATSRRKARLLEAAAGELPESPVRRVEVDFEKESFAERLVESGFREGARTFFIWEGVTYYLTRETVKETLRSLREIGGRGSEVVADFWYLVDDPDVLSVLRRVSPNLLLIVGEPILFGIHPEDLPPFLERLHIQTRAVVGSRDLEERYLARRRAYPAFYLARAGW